MAPFQGPSKQELLAILSGLLAERKLPITLGKYESQAVVEHVDGVYRVSRLELDRDAARKEGEARLARGESWMPEMEWRFLRQGEILIEERSKKDFVAQVSKMRWSFGPD